MKLSQTRQALVEEFDFCNCHRVCLGHSEQEKKLSQALNDYTESILRMVEGKSIKEPGDVDLTQPGAYQFVEYPKHPSGVVEVKSFNQALNDIKEELVK